MLQNEKKKKQGETVTESASRLGRFRDKMQEPSDATKNIQKFAQEEAKKKPKKPVEPSEGFLTRMMNKYWYKKEK